MQLYLHKPQQEGHYECALNWLRSVRVIQANCRRMNEKDRWFHWNHLTNI